MKKYRPTIMEECLVQRKTSLADSRELRVKSAVKQLVVQISHAVLQAPEKSGMWSYEPLPAMPSCSLGDINQHLPATESRCKGTNLRTNATR